MSNYVTEHMVKQFSSNVWHLSQQKASRLRGLVRTESLNGEEGFYDYYGPVVAQQKVGRHSDTTYQETEHGRRRVTMSDFFWADLVDKEDKLRLIHDPESQYAKAAMMAMGRKMDDIIVNAALGTAYSGKEGATSVVIPDSQKIGAFDGTVSSGLNVRTLRAIKKKFHQNEVDMEPLYLVCTAEQMDDLLGETEITSQDYNTVRALVNGEVDTFMGFKFIRIEAPIMKATTANITTLDPTTGAIGSGAATIASGARRCFAFAGSGLLLALGTDVKGRIDELPQKHYSKQVYASMSMGATRLEESKIVEVLVKE
jgi:hypothetical protein